MRLITVMIMVFFNYVGRTQNNTDVSLFFKKDSTKFLNEVSSNEGDLFNELGHHGPAIENEWLGFRIYFNKLAAIDIYSKTNKGLELGKVKWYPNAEQQKNGWGADYYKAGNTVGLGGIRLWDGEKVVPLNPVSKRSARVVKEGTTSYMEMLSEGVPYKNINVDILVRVTVYTGLRKAKVEAFALTSKPVQFVTGINHHPNQKVKKESNYFITWGLHPEDVALEKIEIGAAIIFDPNNFIKKIDKEDEYLLISKPTKRIESWITSANAKEADVNNFERFVKYVGKESKFN
ncbi:DUF4861 family protein [Maribacter luteus]|uniref:DUF4861 domain-containing protein n=1 Tax=Maribacter luteus TaxID=2594478 RepID=A0A6I2MRA8_9FLAO|nr:DUF4861 family protein [Maribacter luteus]MRX65372.1 DUF4861 domain-containing protein [Maribacter luteus]